MRLVSQDTSVENRGSETITQTTYDAVLTPRDVYRQHRLKAAAALLTTLGILGGLQAETIAEESSASPSVTSNFVEIAPQIHLDPKPIGPGHHGQSHDNAHPKPNHHQKPGTNSDSESSPEDDPINVEFILVDDLSSNIMPYMPFTNRLIGDKGATLTNNYISEGLCCPSRATILTGRYAHNTGVMSNHWPQGGYGVFHESGGEKSTIATWLQDAGITTGLFGKYMNEYPTVEHHPNKSVPMTYVPKGWDDWVSLVDGNPYVEWNYKLNHNGVVDAEKRGKDRVKNYMTTVLAKYATRFVENNANSSHLSYIAPFGIHSPYNPAPRDIGTFKGLAYPRTPSFNERSLTDKPTFFQRGIERTELSFKEMNRDFRDRVEMAQSVDRMVKRLMKTLRRTGQLDNTYVIFTSDNGFIMGEHGIAPGKNEAYEESAHVPLLIRGPGIKPGSVIDSMVGNVDYAPTIADMLDVVPPKNIDGTSFLPVLTGDIDEIQDYTLLERGKSEVYSAVGGMEEPADTPYRIGKTHTMPFEGVVSKNYKLIRYKDGSWEFYDLKRDEYELQNLLPKGMKSVKNLSHQQQDIFAEMNAAIDQLEACRGVDCIL